MHKIFAISLALLAVPALAVTNATTGSAPQVLMTAMEQGVVEQVDATSIKVGGKTYFLSALTPVYDRTGNKLSAPRITAGMALRFTVADDGQRLKQVWINQ